MSQRSKYCVVGIPDHQGVFNVGGRIGAALGPQAFRRSLAYLKGRKPVREQVRDSGDVPGLGADAEVNHRLAAEFIRAEHAREGVSVVVGGGHDHGYSQLRALARKGKRLGCINIDAHLDVRSTTPVVTSGSPFYLAIESGILDPSRLVEFGIQDQCNSPPLWDYVKRKRIPVVPFSRMREGGVARLFKQYLQKLSSRCDLVVVSFDLDAVAQASAPGVSAPQSEGFCPGQVMAMMEIAGNAPKVTSLGIFELNPVHDLGERTAKLAATASWHFLAQKR